MFWGQNICSGSRYVLGPEYLFGVQNFILSGWVTRTFHDLFGVQNIHSGYIKIYGRGKSAGLGCGAVDHGSMLWGGGGAAGTGAHAILWSTREGLG